jgi:hypothetical protein
MENEIDRSTAFTLVIHTLKGKHMLKILPLLHSALALGGSLLLGGCLVSNHEDFAASPKQQPTAASVHYTLNVGWVKCGSNAKDIGAGGWGTAFMLTTSGEVKKWITGPTWGASVTNGLSIDVGPGGNPWKVGTDLYIYEGIPNQGGYYWSRKGNSLFKDFGIGSSPVSGSPQPWGISYYYSGPGQLFWYNSTGSWLATKPNTVWSTKVDVAPNGNAWKVDADNRVWEGVRGATSGGYSIVWVLRSGQLATDIGVGEDGSVWITGRDPDYASGDRDIYRWNGIDAWEVSNGGGIRISVDKAGNPWIVNSIGDVYRSTSVTNN